MALGDWILIFVIAAYVVVWVVCIVNRYRYILDCPVPLWSVPWNECRGCPHIGRCGRVSSLYREWACTPESLAEIEKLLEERRAELECDNLDKEIVEEDRNKVL